MAEGWGRAFWMGLFGCAALFAVIIAKMTLDKHVALQFSLASFHTDCSLNNRVDNTLISIPSSAVMNS